ncbi:3-oxoacyl-ACP synthase III family protein [Peribacillus simplex]|uniref:3-oxoacyl-ACP synthase III family protein n=1 Tax=Peribacillus simplex TaxID=1478 RepID=UPI003D26DD5D
MIDTVLEPIKTKMKLSFPIGILSTGIYVPDREVTNDELSETLDTSDEWIISKTGIKARRFVAESEATSDMCIAAAKQAMAKSGISGEAIDAIIIATFTPDQILPATSVIVKEAIGAKRALTIDMNQAACAGGIYGLLVGSHFLQNPMIKKVLVIGAESLSKFTSPKDRTTRVFFGDAAGAVILQQEQGGYDTLSWDMDSELSYKVEIQAGGSRKPTSIHTVENNEHFLKMDGRTVWNKATKHLPKSIKKVIQSMNLTPDEVDHYIIHQANINIIKEMLSKLNQPIDKTTINIDKYGNTGSATVFTVLHQAIENKSISEGDNLVFAGIGAGFIWGALGFQKS